MPSESEDRRERLPRGPGRARAAILVSALFLLLSLVPASEAQAPPLPGGPPSSKGYLLLNMGVLGDAHVFVRQGGQVRIPLEVADDSADRAPNDPTSQARNPFPHMIQLEVVEPLPFPKGWSVSVVNNTMFTGPGTKGYATLVVQATPAAEQNYLRVVVNGTLTGSDGERAFDDLDVMVQLLPFYAGRALVPGEPAVLPQQGITTYRVLVENQGTYPDWFQIHLNTTKGFRAEAPPRIYVPPLSTREVNLTILAPTTGLYDFGTLGLITVTVRSEGDPAFRYSTTAIVTVKGAHVRAEWIPVLLFALVAGGILTDKTLDTWAERRARDGRPRRPQPTPRQAVVLKELRKRDPQAYKQKLAALAAVYAARRKAWREARRARATEEKRLRREQRAAVKAEKRRRAEQKAADRKREEALEKVRKERLAELRARQKEADKLRAKDEKRAAKEGARAGKLAAKAEKKRRRDLLKLQKAREKELARARKALRKKGKNGND